MTQNEENKDMANERELQIGRIITETAKLNAETAKLQAEIHEVNAHTRKLMTESKWYPVVVGSSLVAAGAAAATVAIKFF
ncbi:hypothetical protein FUT69_09310 [Xylella taiwanensis]|uniref:Uncharacterized protein n=1 Tax=Xylella taiwanensis TaxID=1444770 RepID=Z9JI53_9GAMM|nr:hypothetical protein [Xylella taiwanensis]AXI83539.1 hypothetical protein AB672_06125 [Xylella taiwanensis]EWS78040.1 hypothetical protein AF72_07980 [Xylella taiwanensis]MCD8456613.1 hypothetical protein [Xylella taiwanensis]MCD8459020.1 hypothetical protein [Xylella taiwanensis]MCD8461159.1 hypothetical protein [Xylella taiwanensis]